MRRKALAAGLAATALAGGIFAATRSTQEVLVVETTCDGIAANIVGTTGDDVLNGTSIRDIIQGGPGSDIIQGLGGSDLICGGPGPDDLYGNQGDDTMRGGDDNDSLEGNGGDDTISTGAAGASRPDWTYTLDGNIATGDYCARDIAYGRPCYEGNDWINGGPSNNDRLTGDKGNDYLDGGAGTDDSDYGGDGTDTCRSEARYGCER
jgi:Ca2+-binding RTX toxin-like protein